MAECRIEWLSRMCGSHTIQLSKSTILSTRFSPTSIHGVREANARSVNLGADRPVHGVPVHGAQEDYAEEGSVDGDYPRTEGSESSDAVCRSSPERDEGSGAFSPPPHTQKGRPIG